MWDRDFPVYWGPLFLDVDLCSNDGFVKIFLIVGKS